jgi:hypothetical protein
MKTLIPPRNTWCGVSGWVQASSDLAEQTRPVPLEQRIGESALAVEVVVEGGLRDLGGLGDLLHRHARAVRADRVLRRHQQVGATFTWISGGATGTPGAAPTRRHPFPGYRESGALP